MNNLFAAVSPNRDGNFIMALRRDGGFDISVIEQMPGSQRSRVSITTISEEDARRLKDYLTAKLP